MVALGGAAFFYERGIPVHSIPETATPTRRSHGLTCVTMDGSKIAKKGGMKGG